MKDFCTPFSIGGMKHMSEKPDRNPDSSTEKPLGKRTAEYEILELVKLKLYQRMHGLAPVLGSLELRVEDRKKEGENAETAGAEDARPEGAESSGIYRTDGKVFYLDAERLRAEFLSGKTEKDFSGRETKNSGPAGCERLCLEVLHMLGHCLLGHPFRAWKAQNRKEWELECDLAAWRLAEELWGEKLPFLEKAEKLLKKENGTGTKTLLDEERERRKEAEGLLYVDSHESWGRRDERQAAWWQGQGEKILKQGSPKGRRKAGTARRSRERRLVPAAGGRGDYREILRSLSTWREDARINQEEFQYSWYVYGLRLYGNLPLIEPLEYSEERKISDLVIVLDTSGSCEKELVQIFLEETREILEQERLFFRRFCLHIIQCDNQIQRDDCIRSREEFEKYLENLTIRGGGGTDFRPAFERIAELRKAGELPGLQGILYFTDGCGWYPQQEPDYQVWFVMLKGHYDAIDMPGWIHRLVLEEKR